MTEDGSKSDVNLSGYSDIYSALAAYQITPPEKVKEARLDADNATALTGAALVILICATFTMLITYSDYGGLSLGRVLLITLFILAPCLFLSTGIRKWKNKIRELRSREELWLEDAVSDHDLAKLIGIKMSGPRTYALIDSLFRDNQEVTYRHLLELYGQVEKSIGEDRAMGGKLPNNHSADIRAILRTGRR